jgi:hypothetical protein
LLTISLNVTVQLTDPAFVGLAPARLIELTVGASESTVVVTGSDATAPPPQLPVQVAEPVLVYDVPSMAPAGTLTGTVTVYVALLPGEESVHETLLPTVAAQLDVPPLPTPDTTPTTRPAGTASVIVMLP